MSGLGLRVWGVLSFRALVRLWLQALVLTQGLIGRIPEPQAHKP